MRIYGTENMHPKYWTDILQPDVADVRVYGRKSSFSGSVRGGKARGYFKNKNAKRAARRWLKRAARQIGKAQCIAGD